MHQYFDLLFSFLLGFMHQCLCLLDCTKFLRCLVGDDIRIIALKIKDVLLHQEDVNSIFANVILIIIIIIMVIFKCYFSGELIALS